MRAKETQLSASCGPEGRFYCSNSVCSLWPAPFSYLCVSVRILGLVDVIIYFFFKVVLRSIINLKESIFD